MDYMDSMFDGDPRVQWADAVVYLPDHDGEWTICLEGDRWNAYNQRGLLCEEASWKDTLDEAIAAVIGPPLWTVEAHMITTAAANEGWLDAAGTPDTQTVAGAAAIDNLKDAALFLPWAREGQATGYILCAHGWDLAAALDGLTDDGVCRAILDRVPQTHTYGATDGATG